MKKIVRLTESDLNNIVKRVIKEQSEMDEQVDYMSSDLTSTEAIITMVGTVIGLLGFAGSHYIKSMINKLRAKGDDETADIMQEALSSQMGGEESEEPMMESFKKPKKKK
jgi:hypothetical protein